MYDLDVHVYVTGQREIFTTPCAASYRYISSSILNNDI